MQQATPIDVRVGACLRSRRLEAGLTLEEFAHTLGICPDQMAAHECGAERINPKLLLQAADILGIRVSELFKPET